MKIKDKHIKYLLKKGILLKELKHFKENEKEMLEFERLLND